MTNRSTETPEKKPDDQAVSQELRGALATAPADPFIGKVIDNRYRILSLVAQGGMGRVYQAEQAPLGRVVALKVLDAGKTPESDREMRQRFMLEAAACARLNHPNTIRIFDYGKTWDDVLYISMEYIQGRTLHHVIRQEAPLPIQRLIHITRQICSSLREAHSAGLIHRDLKPSNVMLTRHGEEGDFVKVLDFGLVRQLVGDSELTQVDSVVGSPSYMSPEQIRGERLDQRSDIYSIGVLMYTCLSGRTPFAAESPVKVMMAHLNSPPPPLAPVCPAVVDAPMIEWVIRTCMEKAPSKRFSSMEELLKALRVAERQVRGDQPPMPVLEEGKLVIGEEWVSSAAVAPLSGMSGSISRSSMAVPALPSAPSETSVSTFVKTVSDRKLPILAVVVMGLGGLMALLLLLGIYLGFSHGTKEEKVPEAVSVPAPASELPQAAPAPVQVAPSAPASPPAASSPAPSIPKAPAAKPEAPAAKPEAPAVKPEAARSRPEATPPAPPAPVAAPPKPEPPAAAPPKPEPPAATPNPPKSGGSDLKDPWSH